MIASATLATPFYIESGTKLAEFSSKFIGSAQKIVVSKDETNIQIYDINKPNLDTKICQIEENIKSMIETGSPEENEAIQWKRNLLSFAKGNIATIKIGGNSDTEIYEVKDRIDDAIAAVKSSIEEGVSVGAGASYIKAAYQLPPYSISGNLIKSASESIKRKLLSNLCISDIDKLIIDDILDDNNGINMYGELANLVEDGIIDPTKVIRNCIENAISVATMFLLTDNIAMKVEDILI